MRLSGWLVLALLLGPIIAGALSVTTAANTVPNTKLGSTTQVTGVTELRPYMCAGLTLTTLVTGATTTLNGTNGSDLILGRSTTRNLNGRNGDDCIVGGSGARDIDGGSGYDICIGPYSASFESCASILRR